MIIPHGHLLPARGEHQHPSMNPSSEKQSRLATYLTVGLGAGCLAGHADAATVVSFYGPGAKNSFSTPATPPGIDVGSFVTAGNRYLVDSATAFAAFSYSGGYFTNGSDLVIANYGNGQYFQAGGAINGAVLGSNQNYANLSFDSGTGPYEAVGQFYLDGAGGGYLVALARNDDNSALSISDGKAAIDAVPEPSSLVLLALGAGGLLARRKRTDS
jgi:hypothetical protein